MVPLSVPPITIHGAMYRAPDGVGSSSAVPSPEQRME